MKNIIFLILLFPSSFIYSQKYGHNIIGTYHSRNNEFEQWSTMSLQENNRFIYYYGTGGCQSRIVGTYKVVDHYLIFDNDLEFSKPYLDSVNFKIMDNDSSLLNLGPPKYPDLGLIKWKIGKNYIKPSKPVDCGCFTESRKHKKRTKPTN